MDITKEIESDELVIDDSPGGIDTFTKVSAERPQRRGQRAHSASRPAKIVHDSLQYRRDSTWIPPSTQFESLALGWIREVIFDQNPDKSFKVVKHPKIVYHSPPLSDDVTNRYSFASRAKLIEYINPLGLSVATFTFRQDVLGGLSHQEILRGIHDDPIDFHKVEVMKLQYETMNTKEQGPESMKDQQINLTRNRRLSSRRKSVEPKSEALHSASNAMYHGENLSDVVNLRATTKKSNLSTLADCQNVDNERPGCEQLPSTNLSATSMSTDEEGLPTSTFVSKRKRKLTPKAAALAASVASPSQGTKVHQLNVSSAATKRPRLEPKESKVARPGVTRNQLAGLQQSVISIGGRLFVLVTGRPSNCEPNDKENGQDVKQHVATLKPTFGDNLAVRKHFTVEEGSDGRCYLVGAKSASEFQNGQTKPATPLDRSKRHINELIADHYATVVPAIFGSLRLPDLLNCMSVCRLWRDLLIYQLIGPSNTLCLKDCRVTNWPNLATFINRHRVKCLTDVRSLPSSGSVKDVRIESISTCRMSGITAQSIIGHSSPFTSLYSLHGQVVAGESESIPTSTIGKRSGRLSSVSSHLREINLRGSPSMSIKPFLTDVMAISRQLTKLALLNVSHLQMGAILKPDCWPVLDHIELGDVNGDNSTSALAFICGTVKHVRLENLLLSRDCSIAPLCSLTKLERLELINVDIGDHADALSCLGSTLASTVQEVLIIPRLPIDKKVAGECIGNFVHSLSARKSEVRRFYFGLTNEQLNSWSGQAQAKKSNSATKTGSIYRVPVIKSDESDGQLVMMTLNELIKLFSASLSGAKQVKLLKMSDAATKKQYLSKL